MQLKILSPVKRHFLLTVGSNWLFYMLFRRAIKVFRMIAVMEWR